MTHLISTILVLRPCNFKLDLELQTWIYEKSGWIWSTTKKNHEQFGQKITLIGQKIALIGQKMPKLIFSDFSCFFLAVQLLNVHVFWEFKPCLSYIYLSPCHRIIFEYEVIVWGWKPVRFTQLSANALLLCASDIANLQEGCMILWDSFFWDFSIMHPLIHAIQYVKLISIPLNQHFVRKVPRAIFFCSG